MKLAIGIIDPCHNVATDFDSKTWLQRYDGSLISLIIAVLAVSVSACGPVNGEKKTDSATSLSAATFHAVNSSRNNAFLVYSTLQTSALSTTLRTPQVGDNVFLIRCVHADDLRETSDQTKVTVNYWMPDMPAMGKSNATALRQVDGTYSVTLFFSMTGRWQMTVSIQDGSNQDEYVFETKF